MDIHLQLSIHGSDLTIKNVKEFIKELEAMGVSQNYQLGGILEYASHMQDGIIEVAVCGDCYPYEENFDLMITTHDCRRNH